MLERPANQTRLMPHIPMVVSSWPHMPARRPALQVALVLSANTYQPRSACWPPFQQFLPPHLGGPVGEHILVAPNLPHVGRAGTAQVEAHTQPHIRVHIKQVVEAAHSSQVGREVLC
jgi:hypothetical protein